MQWLHHSHLCYRKRPPDLPVAADVITELDGWIVAYSNNLADGNVIRQPMVFHQDYSRGDDFIHWQGRRENLSFGFKPALIQDRYKYKKKSVKLTFAVRFSL